MPAANRAGRFWATTLSATLLFVAGCQCCPGTEHWLRHVDSVSEKGCRLDRLYNPGTDLTRFGRPDGGAAPNGWICPPGCSDCPRVRDVPVPIFNVYRQPVSLAGAKESYDDRGREDDLQSVEDVPPEAEREIQNFGRQPTTRRRRDDGFGPGKREDDSAD